MTDVQKILYAMATGYHDGQIREEDCEGIAKALNGVPECFHMDALKSFLSVQEQQSEEQPEDYLAVKTFTSTEFHIGDEIIEKHGLKGIYVGSDDENKISVVYELGGAESGWNKDKWHRTGRNFPAVQAILDELKKA